MPRTENRVFFPQTALDQWIVDGTVDLQHGELTLLTEGRRFDLSDAVHVLREVSGTGDAHQLVGRTKTRAFLEELGAEIIETSMLVGDVAYDVETGWVGVPVGTFAEHAAAETQKRAREGRAPFDAKSDEDLLAVFVAKNPGD